MNYGKIKRTPLRTNYKRGDVVIVNFGFSEGTGAKKRPSLIISDGNYNKRRQEVIVLAITSNTERILFGDTKPVQWKEASLLYPSVITGIVRTIKKSMIYRRIGALTQKDFQQVEKNLKKILGF